MAWAKTQKEAIYRVGLKHKLRERSVGGWKANSSTKLLEKKLKRK
jgi:hypothetical protein